MSILRFPSSLADEADKGANHVRFVVREIEDGQSRVYPYTIHLHQPIGFSASDMGNYGTMDKGPMGAGMKTILARLGLGSGAGNEFTSADLTAGALMNMSLLSQIPIADQLDRGARITALELGVAQNPHTYVTYEGHQLRTFQFEYKLISESDREARTIEKIVDIFRNYSLPESTGNLSIQYPAQFSIDFYKGGSKNKFMPQILDCHLTNLSVTYNGTTNAFHKDGAPVETDLSMTFQETKAIVRQDLYGDNDNADRPAMEGIGNPHVLVDVAADEKPEGEG